MITISIGRNNPRKGFEYGIKTLALLKIACFNIAYVLVGRSMKSIMELARQLRVSNCLITPGQVEAVSVAQLLQTSDTYFNLYRRELRIYDIGGGACMASG